VLLILLLIPAAWLVLALFGLTLLRLAARSDGLDAEAWEEWRRNSGPPSLREAGQEPVHSTLRARRRASG
jgi:hypothetical protein